MASRPPRVVRKFTILDAMIFIGSIAGWLALTRYFGSRTNLVTIWSFENLGLLRMARNQGALLLLILSAILIVARLRPPRPRRRRLWLQPGFVASMAAVLGALVFVVETAVGRHVELESWDRFDMTVLWQEWPYVGPSVAGAWLALAAIGRWKGEPGAIDRLGRLVGACWIAEFLLAEDQFGRWVQVLAKVLGWGSR